MQKLTISAILIHLSFLLCVGERVAAEATTTAGTYVVVVSQPTYDQPEWRAVVEALTSKYPDVQVITYAQSVHESLDPLRHHSPRWTCFVTQPKEATQAFVAEVHQVTRKIDDDPFTDTFWGILTGYDAQNALQIARHNQPLVIRKVASGTEVALDCCEEGLWYDELVQGKMVRKRPGEPIEQLQGPDDTTAALVDSLNQYQADLFVTSGHATERDWQIGFRYRNGVFRCSGGQLYGLDTNGNKYPIDSPNPKVYLPIGNCLMGHIDGPDAMALAWLNSAGVKQMMGYTVPTWYGYAGWGCLDYFVEQPGRYSFVEAFFANQHALIHRLMDDATSRQDKGGLAFDQDVVALYGDPAWEARMAPKELPFEQSLSIDHERYAFEVKPNLGEHSFAPINLNGSQRGGRPFVHFFPNRVKNVQILEGEDLQPTITDDFILVPRPESCDPNRTYRVVFQAESLPIRPTSTVTE